LQSEQTRLRWRLGVLAAVAMMVLAIYPQLNLWAMRGSEWNGSYAYNDIDEVAYAAYLQALIDGRPRLNDPFTARDDALTLRQPESLFSIQFIPPYVIALIARPFGINAQWAMIITGALAAFATALALFWLLGMVTNDDRIAATGALMVLCLGTLACAQGAIVELTGRGLAYPYLPFLRRYLPALPFPMFFVFCALVWRSLISGSSRRAAYFSAAGAGLSVAVLVYSYFYLWTTAVAWLACFAVLLLIAKPDGWKRDLKRLAVTSAIAMLALVPYAILLANRATTMDSVQLLAFTRAPDLLRPPTIIGMLVLATLIYSVKRGRTEWRDRRLLFAAAFALTPLVVFNQQIITGRSLQPIHYEVFIVNYVAMLAVVLSAALIWAKGAAVSGRTKPMGGALLIAAVLTFGWGVVEADITTHILDEQNIIRDEAMPVGRRLRELAREAEREGVDKPGVVFSPNLIQGDDLPTLAPQGVLWARHLHIFSGTTWQESKERFYQHLYYTGLGAEWLEAELNEGNYVAVIALFGWGRHHDRLTVNATPLTREEIAAEAKAYADYIASFSRERAAAPLLSAVVTHTDGAPDLKNLDRWYERDVGEHLGKFILYRVKLRP
jgi:hypothetical protein